MVINNHERKGLGNQGSQLQVIDDRIDELMIKTKLRIELEVTVKGNTVDPKKEKEQIEQVVSGLLEKLRTGLNPEVHSDTIIDKE